MPPQVSTKHLSNDSLPFPCNIFEPNVSPGTEPWCKDAVGFTIFFAIVIVVIVFLVFFVWYVRGTGRNKAPKGAMAVIFSDIEASTKLWEIDEVMMDISLKEHNRVVRKLIGQYGGYEVKSDGDAFMVVFRSAIGAMNFCLALQLDLLQADWPETLLTQEFSGIMHDSDSGVIRRGLRVRLGGHFGEPICRVDDVSKRMDYFGPVVNKAARVGGLAAGGQILVSQSLRTKALEESHRALDRFRQRPLPFEQKAHGAFQLKGITGETPVIEILPKELLGRGFTRVGPYSTEDSSGFGVRDRNDSVIGIFPRSKVVTERKWLGLKRKTNGREAAAEDGEKSEVVSLPPIVKEENHDDETKSVLPPTSDEVVVVLPEVGAK